MTKHHNCPSPHHKRTQPIIPPRSRLASGALVGLRTYLHYLLPLILLFAAQAALASNGADDWGLKPMIDKILNFIEGSGGKLLGLVGLVIAVYYAAFQLDLKPAGIWFGIAVVILGAPNIINTVFSSVI